MLEYEVMVSDTLVSKGILFQLSNYILLVKHIILIHILVNVNYFGSPRRGRRGGGVIP